MDLEVQILLYYLKVFSLIVISLVFIIFIYISYIINKKNILENNVISISKGQNFSNVIKQNFQINNKVESRVVILYYYIYTNIFNKYIHYGDFYLDNNISYFNIIRKISKPSNILNKISIIDGWSKNELNLELSKYFTNSKDINYEDILADTYFFEKNENFDTFYLRLKSFKNDYLSKIKKNNSFMNQYTNEQIITIGSLIEKEGLDYYDKRKISSVIFNRLNKNMRLQIDATVLYAITNGNYDLNRNLNLNDLKIEHPFNTYLNNGIPPKPISYVSTKTIDILSENYKTEYLFYFYNNSLKKHVFSINYDEHKKKLNEYRKK